MGSNKLYVGATIFIINSDNKPVLIATNIKNGPICANQVGTRELLLQLIWGLKSCFEHKLMPDFKRLHTIQPTGSLPVFAQRGVVYNVQSIN
jgi:hypothetical protein